jgi:uncharacterized protein
VGKILMWVVILGIAYVVWQLLVVSKRRVDRSRGEGDGDAADGGGGGGGGGGSRGDRGNGHAGRLRAPEAMMQCAVCGVHLPGSEAFFARGRVFCSAEHRDEDEAARRAPGDRAER